jgi:photosystem II stability/assembly factor-like uncharacterized protein
LAVRGMNVVYCQLLPAHAGKIIGLLKRFGFAAAAALAVLAAALSAGATSTWTKTGPFPGAFVPSVAYNANGSILFAGGVGVVFRSTDDGRKWTRSALPSAYATSVVLHFATSPLNKNLVLASTLDVSLAGAAGDGMLFSTNGGVTWQAGNIPNQVEASNSQYPYYPVWDPRAVKTAYAGTAGGDGDGAVFRTTDGGKDWSLVFEPSTTSEPFPLGPIEATPTKPVTLYLAAGDFSYATDGDEFIAESTNGGLGWTNVEPLNYVGFTGYGQVLTAFAHDPKAPRTVYALASGYQTGTLQTQETLRFEWTPNAGNNWVERIAGLPKHVAASALAVDPASGSILLPLCCAPHHELYISKNQGRTWTADGLVPATTSSLAVQPGRASTLPARLVSGGHGGVLVSDNAGKSWTSRNRGLDQPNIGDIVADPMTGVLYVGSKAGVLRSVNGGTSFAAIDAALTDRNVQALALDTAAAPHVLYAATNSGVYRCENPAAAAPRWTEVTPPAATTRFGSQPGTYTLATDGATAGRLYVSSNPLFGLREIYRTDDYGAHWSVTGFHDASGNDIPLAMTADPKAPGTLYAAAAVLATVYKSTNAGKTFTAILGAEGNKFLIGQRSALNPRTLYLLATDPNTSAAVIMRSTNGGKTWDGNANAAPAGGALLDLAADPASSRIYALVALRSQARQSQGYALAVFESTNRGFSWIDDTGDLPVLPAAEAGGVATRALLRATGDKLLVAAPLASRLFEQNLTALR